MVDLTARSRRTFFIVMNELVFKGQNDQVLKIRVAFIEYLVDQKKECIFAQIKIWA
jgi:hypothetical protein|nr:MAG TPA: hypothetical protein [Caudoviricetes sp.]